MIPETRIQCPCCGAPMLDNPDDAPFCWICGVYADEPAELCGACHQPPNRKET